MPWTVLLFAAGSLAIPAPTILLVPPHPSSQDDPIHIACMAPRGFLGANFTLYRGGHVVQLLQAPADQLEVTFNLSRGGNEAPGGTFHCQYGVMGEHSQTQLSDLSEPVQVTFPVPTWILALSLSLVGALLFLAVLVAVVMVIRKVKVTNAQKKRERESCWAQVNFANSDMSFDNSLFAISMLQTKMWPPWMLTLAPLQPPASPCPRRGPPPHHPHLNPPTSALSGPRSDHWGPYACVSSILPSPSSWPSREGSVLLPATSGGSGWCFLRELNRQDEGAPSLGSILMEEQEQEGHRHWPVAWTESRKPLFGFSASQDHRGRRWGYLLAP
ncbi:protein HIDE1 isoform X1 [Elephas maximus indicus]|uniref:protein HIDE1 isoform X1 n=1 Tax=Elephas maximus indicus TaxID=99487 RepID=UPI002116C449|nr:protein HIDE1 isoform X1 [Elephas maximus indicus]